MFGLGLGRLGTVGGQTIDSAIRALFSDGIIYDPSDFSTLFTDAAGTTPVTSLEQPVGLMLDKSRGLVLGSELVTNGDFSSATGWTVAASWAIGSGVSTKTAGADGWVEQPGKLTVGRWYQFTVVLTSHAGGNLSIGSRAGSGFVAITASGARTVTGYFNATAAGVGIYGTATTAAVIDSISVREIPGAHAYHTPGDTTTRPVVSRRINEFIGTETLATQNVTTRATNYSLRFSGTGSITLSGTATGTYSAGTHTITCTAGTLTATVSGSVTQAMLTPSDLAVLPYQRVTTTTDYDASSVFPTFLRCDGANDGMQTNAIDFSGTDKMFVGAAVRKLSDATQIFAELSSAWSGATGTFASYCDSSGTQQYASASRGTAAPAANQVASVTSGYAAPNTSVFTSSHDIAGDLTTLRLNGAAQTSATGDKGAGNFGNHKLYLFMRAGTSLPFNGWMFGLLVKGATLSASQIALSERWLASKTKTVTL